MEDAKQEENLTKPDYPIVMMSCKTGANRDLFLKEI